MDYMNHNVLLLRKAVNRNHSLNEKITNWPICICQIAIKIIIFNFAAILFRGSWVNTSGAETVIFQDNWVLNIHDLAQKR